jgi:hypothetical protein
MLVQWYLIGTLIVIYSSDIPDWCFAEMGLNFNMFKPHSLSPEGFKNVKLQSTGCCLIFHRFLLFMEKFLLVF